MVLPTESSLLFQPTMARLPPPEIILRSQGGDGISDALRTYNHNEDADVEH